MEKNCKNGVFFLHKSGNVRNLLNFLTKTSNFFSRIEQTKLRLVYALRKVELTFIRQ